MGRYVGRGPLVTCRVRAYSRAVLPPVAPCAVQAFFLQNLVVPAARSLGVADEYE